MRPGEVIKVMAFAGRYSNIVYNMYIIIYNKKYMNVCSVMLWNLYIAELRKPLYKQETFFSPSIYYS